MTDSESQESKKDADQPQLTGTRTRTSRVNHISSSTRRRGVPTSSPYFVSESLILAFLFTIIVLFVPSLFYHISQQILHEKKTLNTAASSSEDGPSATDTLRSLLTFAISYVPNVSLIVIYLYRIVRTLAYPILLIISFLMSVFEPMFIILRLLFQSLVILPFRASVALIGFLYPIYVFIGVACVTGGLVGLGARTIVQTLRSLYM